MIEFLMAHDVCIWWLTTVSLITFAGTLIVAPWLIVQMPADYFSHQSRRDTRPAGNDPLPKIIVIIVKNTLGLVLIAAGMIMLFIPGQGLLTIGVGIVLLDFPGKYTVERWAVRRGPVLRSINHIRRRARRPPLEL